ncbi:MAG TPA: peptidylprolyl isomerase [Pirellulales bacterium]|nr:peptidylprolyl isomerase [Pirellulales bacterium]
MDSELVFERQVAERVAEYLAANGILAEQMTPQQRRERTKIELDRMIDRKLLCQAARRSLPPEEQPSDEVLLLDAWYERSNRANLAVSAGEIEAHYRAHSDRYQLPAAVRWERQSVRFNACRNREEALQMAAYARERTTGAGVHTPSHFRPELVKNQAFDWTQRSDLPAGSTARFLFAAPVLAIGPVEEDDETAYFVRLLERRPARAASLADVADTIRLTLTQERRARWESECIQRLRATTPIWTAFQPGASAALQ